MKATSTGSTRERMRPGISERKTGTQSARPSLTACRTFGPVKRARWRKEPAYLGSTWSAAPKVRRCVTSTSCSSPARPTRALSSSSGLLQPAWSQTWSPERTTFTASSADVTLRR